ncbi:phage head-tail adapter protein [Vallitalea maricola]|uniref:Uncharacterized protein n=1 Tax=Vallitalea maricola TaxID=3074433 RepID=A0ACB5UEC8_9FIRM|nr:hypothetical protein AN2V17_01210 [Vallitalea sp. AN17-2]
MKEKAELSLLFKEFQGAIKKKDEFEIGIKHLLEFRKELWEIYQFIFDNVNEEEYSLMPLAKDKTIAYFLYHLTRIEDIPSNTLILDQEQIFYKNDYQNRIQSPISTTGNEIPREQLVEFSKQLNIDELKNYITDVFQNTNKLIENMTLKESRTKVSEERKEKLIVLNSVSTDEKAFWLVDYWCKKNYRGLLLMPFSRHQFLHLNGCLRIYRKLRKIKK